MTDEPEEFATGLALRDPVTGKVFSAPFREAPIHAPLLAKFGLSASSDFESGYLTVTGKFVSLDFFVKQAKRLRKQRQANDDADDARRITEALLGYVPRRPWPV